MRENNIKAPVKEDPSYLRRHNLFVVWTHWVIALSSLLLIFSGWGQILFFRRHRIIALPGLSWSEQHAFLLQLHYVFSALLIAMIAVHIAYHLIKKERALLPQGRDFVQALPLPGQIRRRFPPPEHFKYYANQRLSYALTGLALFLLVFSGVLKTYKNFPAAHLPAALLRTANQLHSIGTYLLVAAIVIHVIAIHVARKHRPLIRSMIDGMVSRRYAQKHFPRWVARLEEEKKEENENIPPGT